MTPPLHDPARHEPLQPVEWDARVAARAIERIAHDTEAHFSPAAHWPNHPLDADDGESSPVFNLYSGAGGVVWALHHLQAQGVVELSRDYGPYVGTLLPLNRAWLTSIGMDADNASYLMGETGLLLVGYALSADASKLAQLETLIAGNIDHPGRELMWGAPGTMLAALFLHRRTREARWAGLYVEAAARLWSQLEYSSDYRCMYWPQDLYGRRSAYLGAVHGFAATAAALIAGRDLIDPDKWRAWQQAIVTTICNTAERDDGRANWPAHLYPRPDHTHPPKRLMQFCHGAPGMVVCLADLPAPELDADLVAAGEAIWSAGPLRKGSNLCHGTGGNGYAFLKLYHRTKDERWLERARAFAMHAIAQMDAHARQYGQMRYSLWTGDPGLAIYLADCIRGRSGAFPTLDVLFG
jgi:hypothetical protein